MQDCTLPYIPQRLHCDNRPIIGEFKIGEFLYRRCKPEVIANPFKNIQITELSHNRSGLTENALCNPDDVLYSIREDEPFEKYEDKVVCRLRVKSLNGNGRYKKSYTQSKNNVNYICDIELFHEPETCMYPHCVFRIWVNGEIVNPQNHNSTLGKLDKIRTELKEELASMIVQRQISQEDNPINQ